MSDGARVAASLYVPDGDGPWPAVLEALPYRKDDDTAGYQVEYERLAAAGYVVCRVDLRGTGSSEGIAEDEYPAVERTDLLTVIDWLATQAWSTGAVGMYGTSYSGFNAIQLAMERPPALKAIIPIFATDDRYADDVHYFGGAVKQLDLVDYPTYMIAMNALPPVPSIYGDGWRDEWERRVRGTEPWVLTWLAHQRFDDYWRFGSLRPDYDADRGGDHDRRRVGRRLSQQHVADVRAAPLSDTIGDRTVGPRIDGHLVARAERRPGPRDDPLVGSLAQGRGQRDRPRAADRALRAAIHTTGRDPAGDAWRVAVRADVAGRASAADERSRCPTPPPTRRRATAETSSTFAATSAGPHGSPARANSRGASPTTNARTKRSRSATRGRPWSRTSRSWVIRGSR